VADDNVRAIVLNIDSPGGSIFGTEELFNKIMAARGSKPITAVVNSVAASAAFWIASAADEIVITPGGMIGSVGVYMVHTDLSAAIAEDGVKETFISAS
jgi:ClpP class serine protease